MGFNIMDLMNGATRAAVEGVDNYEAITLATTKNTRQYIHQCVISMMQTEIYYRRKKIINQTTPPGYRI